MSEAGVHTHNAFALLDDEAPPKQTKAKEVKEEAPKKEVKRTSDRDRPTPRVEGGDRRTDGGHVGGRGGGRGGRGGRGGGRGGGESGREGGRERKEFDAHVSRSGKTREPKKDGAGKFNEGSVRDVIADGTSDDRRSRTRRTTRKPDEETETKVEGEEVAAEGAAEGAPASEEKPAAPEEPAEPPTKTYTEFLASKKQLDSDLAIQVREVQNDESQFKAVKAIAKTEEKNPYIISPAEEKEKAPKAKKDKAKHISLDEFTAVAGASTRGGTRGRGGRGRERRGDARSLVVNDSNFPTFAAKEKK